MSEKIESLNHPSLIVIGGGFAGLELAKKLSHQHFRVLLLDKHNYHTFQPLLYQVATGGLGSDAIAYPLRKVIGPMPNVAFRMAEVQEIRYAENKVVTNVGEFPYDYLVLATGSTTNFFGNEELETLTMPLKSIPEALDIRSYLLQEFEKALVEQSLQKKQEALNFVIVGAGPTGVELAGAVAEIRSNVLPSDYTELDKDLMNIHLIEAGDRVLSAMSERSSHDAREFLERMGVNVSLNTKVLGYDGRELRLEGKPSLHAETVIWSAGVKGEIPEGLAPEQKARGNRVKVNPFNQVEGYSNVFAIGDVASMVLPDFPAGHPMVAPVAIQQAHLLAKNLNRLEKKQEMKPFKYFDKGSMATVGRNKAVVDMPPKIHFKGWFAWYVWMFVHLLLLVGFRNRLIVFVNWAWNYFSYERAIRLIIRPYTKKTKLTDGK